MKNSWNSFYEMGGRKYQVSAMAIQQRKYFSTNIEASQGWDDAYTLYPTNFDQLSPEFKEEGQESLCIWVTKQCNFLSFI